MLQFESHGFSCVSHPTKQSPTGTRKSSLSLRLLISSSALLLGIRGLFGLKDELERSAGWETVLGLSRGAHALPRMLVAISIWAS